MLSREIIPYPFCYLRPGYLEYPTGQEKDSLALEPALPSTIHMLANEGGDDEDDFDDTDPGENLIPFDEGVPALTLFGL